MKLSDAEQLAKQLMSQHGLNPSKFKFTNGKRQLGVCYWKRQPFGHPIFKYIGLSRYLVKLNDETEARYVILHEIAHALVGYGHGHDRVWKRKVVEIGGNPDRINNTAETPKGRYVGTCPICGEKYYKHRAGKRVKTSMYRCRKDGGRFKFVDTGEVIGIGNCSR